MLLAHEASLKRQQKNTPHIEVVRSDSFCLGKHTYVTHLEMNLNIFSQKSYPFFFLTTLIKKLNKKREIKKSVKAATTMA